VSVSSILLASFADGNSLGYSSSPATDLPTPTALHVTRPRKQDRRQRKVTRSVFLCYVLGATGSGKTSLLRRFVNKPVTGGEDGLGEYEPTTKVLSVVNSVEMEGEEKYLVVSVISAACVVFLIGRVNCSNSGASQSADIWSSCKSSGRNTSRKPSGIARSSTWQT
jgi:hypothetical protein